MNSVFNKTEIERVFKNQTITDVKEITHGYDQNIFIITTSKNDKYVVKYPKKQKRIIDREKLGESICVKNNIPHAKIIYSDEHKYIQDFAYECDLANITLSSQEYVTLYTQIGQILKSFHERTEKHFGKLFENEDYFDAITYFTSYFNSFKDSNEIPTHIRKKLPLYFSKMIETVKNDKPVFIHDDLHEYNIRIKENKITAIIDFGDARGGIKEQDYALMYIDDDENLTKTKIASSQEKVDFSKIEFCATLRMMFFLDCIDMSEQRTQKILQKLKNILEKNL